MSADFDIIIIGSGPAGVSSAFPLLESKLKILIVDGGHESSTADLPPQQSYIQTRQEDKNQSKWLIGDDFYALHTPFSGSPKLRAPTHQYVFKDFLKLNRIQSQNFNPIGSLAVGGLSNAWGCGVARLSASECETFPFDYTDLLHSYEAVTRRIGISGQCDDDLIDYFGLDSWAQPAVKLDPLHQFLYQRYRHKQKHLLKMNFRLGRSRLAVLSHIHNERDGCEYLGNCLWGCKHRALYSASDELAQLKKSNQIYHQKGFVVEKIKKTESLLLIEGTEIATKIKRTISAHKVILAAGTLASTGIVLRSLNLKTRLPLHSSPYANFLLWLPHFIGDIARPAFGLGQLSFTLKLDHNTTAFGSMLSTHGIPVSEFLSHLPCKRRFGIDILKVLLPSCIVGNVFLPSTFSNSTVQLMSDNTIMIDGAYHSHIKTHLTRLQSELRKIYLKLGAILLPKSFNMGLPGSDFHYFGTLPMRAVPSSNETDALGQIPGFSGVHIVDGSSLPIHTEKFHTLTIMANADRVGRWIINNW